jgi:hypothetical protein
LCTFSENVKWQSCFGKWYGVSSKKLKIELGIVITVCNSSTRESEAGGLRVESQLAFKLHSLFV